ncbi:hypothetical protein C3L33_18453, partial [Rhododendron williamsianum]
MAGSNYASRAAYNDGRNPTSYMSGAGYTDDRNITSYGENGYSDHVCRPVIVDAEGRKRPIISYVSPNASQESFVTTRTERIVEHVRAPVVVTDYDTYGSQARVEPLKEYGVTNDKRYNPSTTVYDRPEYGYNSPSKMEPVRNYGVANDNWRGSSLNAGQDRPEYGYNSPSRMEPVRNYGVANDNGRGSSLNAGQDRPQKVEDFVTKVQTEVSRPTRTGLLSPNLWRNPPSSTAQGYGATNGYGGEYANNNNQLSGPINEIGKALEILKDTANPSSIATAALQSRLPVLASTVAPKRDSYTDTINSREAAKRYGNLNLASRPFQTGESYTGTIDSREAAQRYGGARV